MVALITEERFMKMTDVDPGIAVTVLGSRSSSSVSFSSHWALTIGSLLRVEEEQRKVALPPGMETISSGSTNT